MLHEEYRRGAPAARHSCEPSEHGVVSHRCRGPRPERDEPLWLAEADAASPSGRILRPEDTAASVVHLLSESASMVTGAILDISPDMLPGIMSGETCC